jgi:hypothetical protein
MYVPALQKRSQTYYVHMQGRILTLVIHIPFKIELIIFCCLVRLN